MYHDEHHKYNILHAYMNKQVKPLFWKIIQRKINIPSLKTAVGIAISPLSAADSKCEMEST